MASKDKGGGKGSKTAASKSLKEKRAAKKAKGNSGSSGSNFSVGGASRRAPPSCRAAFRWVLAGFMVFAGIAIWCRLMRSWGRCPPGCLRTPIVWVSGVIEIGLGVALALARGTWRRRTGWALALFLLLVFPGFSIRRSPARTRSASIRRPSAGAGSCSSRSSSWGRCGARGRGLAEIARCDEPSEDPGPLAERGPRNVGELDRREGGGRVLLVEPSAELTVDAQRDRRLLQRRVVAHERDRDHVVVQPAEPL